MWTTYRECDQGVGGNFYISAYGINVRVVMHGLLVCVHQRDSEGICRGERECWRMGGAKGMVGLIVWRDGEEEVSGEMI